MKKIIQLSVIILFMCFTSPAHAQVLFPDLKTAEHAYKAQDYQKALNHWKPLAERQEEKALLGLGRLYSQGRGVKQDPVIAMQYFLKSAEQNNKKAQYEIAYAYEKGRGVTKDLEKAKTWYLISANNGYERSSKRLALIDEEYQITQPSIPKNKKNYKIKTTIKSQFISEENLSLGTKSDTATAFITDAKVTATYSPIKDIRLQTQIRGVHSAGSAQSNTDDDDETMDTSFVEVRQAWVEFKNIFKEPPLSLKVGKQRFRESRGNWWNRDLDAINLSFNSTLTSGFLAIGQNLGKYRIGSDSKLEQDEENRLRLLGEVSHALASNNKISARFLFEHDYSGLENIGKNIQTDDRDNSDYQILWTGLRAEGPLTSSKSSNAINYRADLMSVIGQEKNIATSTGPNTNLRTVSSQEKRDVIGWAFDGSINTKINHWLDPIITLGYAYGSGDNGQGTNTSFRQTGLEGNTSIYPDGRVASPLRNYGEVLRPELSNIHIFNLGLNIPLLSSSDFSANYFAYWRANQNTELLNDGLDTSLSNSGRYIGQAIDLAANINLSEEMKLKSPLMRNTNLRLKLGAFSSGNAYGDAKGELTYKGTAEFRVKF